MGPNDYCFRRGIDIIPGRRIPSGVAAALSGHIHRAQLLSRDLKGRRLPAPVIYPGSVERTAFAERHEVKQYVVLELAPTADGVGRLVRPRFVPLPARPMIAATVTLRGLGGDALVDRVTGILRSMDPDAVIRLRVPAPYPPEAVELLTAARLRQVAPSTQNVSIRFEGKRVHPYQR